MTATSKHKTLLRQFRGAMGWRSRRPRPHFLGIGTQKGGTTSLYRLLKPHPEIFLPNNKEVHYFTKHYALGEAWYIHHFEAAAPGQLRGEITPYYLFHEAAPSRIQDLRPDMRLIALLRDPVERSLSHYFHSCRMRLEYRPLEEALAAEMQRLSGSVPLILQPGGTHTGHQEHSYVARSRYDQQLQRYFARFGRNNLLVLRSEDLFECSQTSLKALSDFLGIAPFSPDTVAPNANRGEGESAGVSMQVRAQLAQELQPTYEWLERELGFRWPQR